MKTMKTFLKLFVLIGFVSLTLTCTNFLDFQEKIGNKNIVYSIKITPTNAKSGESLIASTQKSTMGAVITLTATLPTTGRHVTLSTSDGFLINPMTISESDTSKTATFEMPAKDVAITASFTDSLYDINIIETGNQTGESLIASTQKSTMGAVITLTATLPTTGRHVTLSTSDGFLINPMTISESDTSKTATFEMPAKDVAITASFNDSEISKTISGTSFKLKLVPGGKTFTMGEHVESTTPQVTLTKSYYLGETEVTQSLWEAVWGTTWPGTVPSDNYGKGANYPAYYLNWYDCVAFCNELTKADSSIADTEQVYYADASFETPYTKKNAQDSAEVYVNWDKTGYRLPTEAEWEYAARYIDGTNWNCGNHLSGDTEYCISTATGCSHSTADVARISQYAWYSGNSGTSGTPEYGTKEVGQKKSNALGIYDMSGNVWEWCYDWYGNYSSGSSSDPKGAGSGSFRVLRGGSWSSTASYLRSAGRHYNTPTFRSHYIGLRLCRTAP